MSDQLHEDRFKMGLTRPFADRFNRFVENSGGAVEPLQGRMDPNEYKTVYNSLTQSDPELAAEMGNVHESPFIRGNAAMVHYPVNDQWAMKNASRYGLRLRPGFNNIVEPTGLRHKNRPTDFSTMSSDQIRNHLMEIIEGAVQPDIDDDRNPEALSLDAPLLANQSPTPQIDPTAFRDPDKARSSWDEAVDWWLSHNFFDEDVPSGGGLMVGPQEMAKLGNFLKDALLPLMAGDVGLAGVGGLGPYDPLPIPFSQIIGRGAKGAKGAWRAIRGVDEAAEAVSAVVRAGDDLTPSLLRSQGFLGDARLAPTRNIGEGVTVSEVAATRTDLSSIGQIGGPYPDARPFVVVRKADGSLQPFYQSTGDNSGMAGAWLPFDGFGGVINDTFHKSWYRKNRFGQGGFARGTPLHRFGSEENKTLSELLGRELGDAEPTILFDMEGVDTELIPGMSYEDLNDALGTHSDYGDYLAATVDESPTFTGNPMRVETPAGPTVIDLDAPQPDLPPGTALGPDGEVIRIIGLEDEAADVARAEMQAAREAAQEGLPGAPTGRVGASGFAIDELPEGTAASLGKQKWTLDAHNSLSGSPEAVVFDEDTFEIVGYGPLGESFKGPAHIQSRLTDSDYMPDPIRVVMLRAKRSGPGWQEGDYISVQVGYLRETGAPKLGLSDEFGIGGADIPDDIAKEVWDQTWEGFDIGSAERIGGGVGLDPQRGTQPWGNIWTREQDPLSSPSWPQYRNMGVTEAHWIEDQAAQHWTFTQEFIDREYPIVQRYRELQGIDDALEGPPGGVARETGGK
jgi:hypothetical protein